MEDKLNIKLSIPEINYIIKALASAPYSDVFELIPSIQNQAIAQQQAEITDNMDE